MAIDLNNAGPQTSGLGAIPEDSVLKLKMNIQRPATDKASAIHPVLTKAKNNSGNDFIDVKFEVVAGTFQGRPLWNNFCLAGSAAATEISMRTLRAIIESARGISPDATDDNSSNGRIINDWEDMNGMEFVAKLGIEKPKPGDEYINSKIKRVLTVDDDQYSLVMGGGEVISDKPLPEIPEAVASGSGTSWGGGNGSTPPPEQQQDSNGTPRPSWS